MSTTITAIKATVSALVLAGKAGATALGKICAAWKGQQMNEANFNATVSELLGAALEASGIYTSDGSLRKAKSITKLAILAVCNGEEPKPGENLETFAQRIRDSKVLEAKGVRKVRAAKKGASKRKESAKDKGKPASKKARQQAALLLARNNMADAQAIAYLTETAERMALLRQVYAKLSEADKA